MYFVAVVFVALCIVIVCNGSFVVCSTYDYCGADLPSVAVYQDFASKFPHLQLRQVNLVTRHGDRAPTGVLPNIHSYAYDCDQTDFEFMDHSGGKNPAPAVRTVLNQHDNVLNPFGRLLYQGTCERGQLTLKGGTQLWKIGKMLREIYVDEAKWLPESFSNDFVYLRSTDVWRTRMSLTSLMQGMYNESARTSVPVYQTVDLIAETLYPNSGSCPAMAKLQEETILSKGFVSYMAKQEPFLAKFMKTLGMQLKDLGEILEYCDFLHTVVCTNQPLPCNSNDSSSCLSQKQVEQLFEIEDFYGNYAAFDFEQQKQAQLGIGTFVGALRDNIINGTNSFYYYSGHDTTLIAMLGALNITGQRWPPYASQLIFETWTPHQSNAVSDTATQEVIRVLYNGLPVDLPCHDDALQGCSVASFSNYVDTIAPHNLYKSCWN